MKASRPPSTIGIGSALSIARLMLIKAAKFKAWCIGEVVKGTGICRVE